MPRLKLTDRTLAGVTGKPPVARTDYFDQVLPGFGIRVSPTGAASWFLFYRIDGKLQRDIFGRWPAMGLAAARTEARRRLDLVQRNIAPRQAEARERAQEARRRVETFKAVADAYKAGHLAKLRRGAEAWSAIERDLLPAWGDTPIRDLGRGDVMTRLDAIETGRGPYARNRRLALVRHMFNFALDRELVDANPAARIKALPETERERVLSDAEIVEVWQVAGKLTAPGGALVRALLLTGQRRGEVAGGTWPEIDEEGGLWTIPAERMKAGLVHEVPLVPAMLDLLRGLPTANARKTYVFASPARIDAPIGGFSQIKDDLDRHISEAREAAGAEPMQAWRLHDLRRTMRSGLSRLRVPSEIAERVIAHIPGGVRRIYDRFAYRDEKRDALQRWAAHVIGLVNPALKVASIDVARQKRARRK